MTEPERHGESPAEPDRHGAAPAEPAVPDPPPPPRRPLWRDPFILAFVIGAALVTLAVPRFRKIGPPPDVSGTLPAWSLADQQGALVGPAELRGRVALVGLVSERAPESSQRVAAALASLQPRFGVARADVVMLLIDLDARDGAARAAWVAAAAPSLRGVRVLSGTDACGLALAGFAPQAPPGQGCDAAALLARDGRLMIIDAQGRPRGVYGSAGQALFETFQRTLRTCDLSEGDG